jgi:hypothetical protein
MEQRQHGLRRRRPFGQPGGQRTRARHRRLQIGDRRGDRAAEQLNHDILLAGEVAIDCRAADAHARADRIDAARLIAMVGEDRGGGVEDHRAARVGRHPHSFVGHARRSSRPVSKSLVNDH